MARRGETTLRNIEERLERISEAISKIEDDSNNNQTSLGVLDCLDLIARNSLRKRSTLRARLHRSLGPSRSHFNHQPDITSQFTASTDFF